MGSRLTFAQKIVFLMIALIVVTGATITGVTAYQFRNDLVREEARSAFTVYLSVVNYLAGHYKTHGSRYVDHILDFVLDERFLNVTGMTEVREAPRLLLVMVLDENEEEIYTYLRDEEAHRLDNLPPLPRTSYFQVQLLEKQNLLVSTGPISPDGEIPGSVSIVMPTELRAKIRALYLKAGVTMFSVALLGGLMSLAFSQRVLAPIRDLTRAAGQMREGDLSVRIEKAPPDEIGELARTFNQMVSSISRRMDTMERIHDWTLQISKEFNLPKLLVRICAMFRDMSGASFCAIGAVDASGRIERLSGDSRRDVAGLNLTPDQAATLFKGQHVDIPPGEPSGPSRYVFPMIQETRGVVAVLLILDHNRGEHDPEQLSMLANLAQNAGLTIENARLYAELSEKERIQQEMNWARQIQQSLLPRNVPRLEGYEAFGLSRPAREVGGDYYDFITQGGSLSHLIIGDVSGKGVPAGLIMSVVRSLIHTYCEFESAPGAILTRVNRALTQDLDSDMFVTASMLTLNCDDHVLKMVRAGHEPAILFRPNGDILEFSPHGTALGLTDVAHFERTVEEVQTQLEPGDLLFLFTDGLTEARNQAGEEFGIKRLKDAIRDRKKDSLSAIVHELLRTVQDFTANAEQSDDITLLALRRLPTAGG